MGGQLGAVVTDDHARPAAALADAVQLTSHPLTGQGGVDHGRQAFPAEVVDHAQDAKAPAARQGVGGKVERPALIGSLRHHHGRSRADQRQPSCPTPTAILAAVSSRRSGVARP